MENTEFKKMFGKIAEKNKFISAFNGWFKESNECLIALQLQKSDYANYYKLIVKIFIQGTFGLKYGKSKEVLKKIGNIRAGEPNDFKKFLNLEELIADNEREKGLDSLFHDYIIPITDQALSRMGIKKLHQQKKLFLLPAMEKELERLLKEG